MSGWTIAGIIFLVVGIIMAVAGFIAYGNYTSKRESVPWWVYLLIGLGFVIILVSFILFAVPYFTESETVVSVTASLPSTRRRVRSRSRSKTVTRRSISKPCECSPYVCD